MLWTAASHRRFDRLTSCSLQRQSIPANLTSDSGGGLAFSWNRCFTAVQSLWSCGDGMARDSLADMRNPHPRKAGWQVRMAASAMLLACASLTMAAPAAPVGEVADGNATIRAKAGSSEIVITTTKRLAGAIHSLTWNGREFIDSADHGRQLQSASNLDCATPITGETYNPTEAGSRLDGAGGSSTSRLLHWRLGPATLQATTRMAFWLAPGEDSGGNPAKNTTILSDHLVTKRVSIGDRNLPHVIAYDVTFSLPLGERHTHAVFEALTGYMPPAFSEFLRFNPRTGGLEPLSDGPGEGPHPVVLAVPGGGHAMGIYAPPQPRPHTTGPTFGRFRFLAEKVVKWNCVFRVTDQDGIAPGEYVFRMFVIVGDLDTVRGSMRALHTMAAASNMPAKVAQP